MRSDQGEQPPGIRYHAGRIGHGTSTRKRLRRFLGPVRITGTDPAPATTSGKRPTTRGHNDLRLDR
jgi:hypothetical protein